MATFAREDNGELDDRVRLTLDGNDVFIAESYEVHSSYLAGPGHFSLRLGSGDTAIDLISLGRPNKQFQISVGDVVQATGVIDGFEAGGNGGATEVTFFGRDVLAPLWDGFVDAETSFKDSTYTALVGKVLNLVADASGKTLAVDNAANRKLQTGVAIRAAKEPKTSLEIVSDAGHQGSVFRFVQAKLGEKWLQFLRRHLDRAGLFLTASADGNYVLSKPNTTQPSIARITRKRDKTNPGNDRSNVIDARFRLDTSYRYSEVKVYTRGAGRKFGRGKSLGEFDDAGMQAYGFKRPLILRDKTCTDEKQAGYLARRHLAECARQGIHLEYTVKGHSTRSIIDGSRCVWAPDTVVDVDDDEFGLQGRFWVESVTFRRPPTTTTVTLMRLSDLVFGEIGTGENEVEGKSPMTGKPASNAKATPSKDEMDLLGLKRPVVKKRKHRKKSITQS